MYSQAQAESGDDDGADSGQTEAGSQDDVVDAEFEEVDDKEKKS